MNRSFSFQKTLVFLVSILLFISATANCATLLGSNEDLTTTPFKGYTTYELTPQAVYEISSSIIISNDYITIIGNGAMIRKIATADALRITGNHCKIKGIEIDGNSQDWAGVFITGAHNVIDGITSHNNKGHGIGLDGQATNCEHNRVVNCTTYSNRGIGFSINTGGNNIISNNIARGNGLEGFTCDGMSHTGPAYGNIFANNICRENAGGIGGFGIDFAIDNVFTGNIIDGNNNSGMKTQNNQGPSEYNTFVGNILVNNNGYGIELYNGTGGTSHHNKLSGNIFRNNAAGDLFICCECYENVTP